MRFLSIIFLLLLTTAGAFSQNLELARDSHPRFPNDTENFEAAYSEEKLVPASGVEALVKQEQWLRKQLDRFPSPESKSSPPQEKFGHLQRIQQTPTKEEWVLLDLNQTDDVTIEGIALVPAYYPEHSTDSNYGFPKRFKIEARTHSNPAEPILLVDWTEKDFPDPGLFPVFFEIDNLTARTIKLTVTKGSQEGATSFFALDEIMVFRSGNNIAPPTSDYITSSGKSDAPPFWNLNYLVDGETHLGRPLHTTQAIPDFIRYVDKPGSAKQDPVITIDLGQIYSVGRVELHAAKDPELPIPHIALPEKYKVELLKKLHPPVVTRTELVDVSDSSKMRWHGLYSKNGRYVRITFNRLPLHNGRPTLALGELRVISDQVIHKHDISLEKKVTLNHLPENETTPASLLVDGLTNGHDIVPEKQYVRQLAKRALVEKAHRQITQRLTVAHAVRTQRYWTIGITAGGLVFFVLLLWLIQLKNEREKAVMVVQQQIAADLHDDISGNLGTISMISNRLRRRTDEPLSKEKLREIDHLSQESYLSVKEIIWHADSDEIRLSDLLKQIKRTARSILSECHVTYDFPDEFDNIVVPVKTRRNVILLIKESLYNCAKYARAENMLIRAEMTRSLLTFTMRDDGCGFDSSCDSVANSESGRGLKNMQHRANLLGADLTIQSAPGEGTEIKLSMPITSH